RNLVHSGALGIRSVLPEARDAAVDDAGIDPAQGVVVDLETVLYLCPEILEHDVGIAAQAVEHLASPVGLQGHGDRALVAVQVLPVGAGKARLEAARIGTDHLRDLRAVVGQHPRAGRSRARVGEVEDLDVGEWTRARAATVGAHISLAPARRVDASLAARLAAP